jgi:hypothetical protein
VPDLYTARMSLAHASTDRPDASLIERLNGSQHEVALRLFMVIVLAHWGEHLLQGFQIYFLGWPVPEARGLIGYFFPWVIESETLHYAYALVMLIGLWVLRSGYTGVLDRRFWTIALAIQFFHHIEHLLLILQSTTGYYLGSRPAPTSIAQLWIPRVELHLFYNTIVFIPMVVAMYYHMFPTRSEAAGQKCTCNWEHGVTASV